MGEVPVDNNENWAQGCPVSLEPEAPSTTFSIALLTTLVKAGLRDIVLSPGSRSQALALVSAELERLGAVDVHVRIDERAAGFLALGLTIESGAPAAIVTTSGTATANLFPAILEAHHSGVPLIVLTADRPEELRGIGSNQTTNQAGIYGTAVRWAADGAAPIAGPTGEVEAAALARRAIDAALGSTPHGPGPVHLNLAFREPLSSAVRDLSGEIVDRADLTNLSERPPLLLRTKEELPADAGGASSPEYVIAAGRGTVIVAGANAGEEAERVARAGGWPLFAEVSSGARFGPNLIVAYRELLRETKTANQIDRVVVFGHPTLSREIPALIAKGATETIVVDSPGADRYNPGHAVSHFTRSIRVKNPSDAVPSSSTDREWLKNWVAAGRAVLEGEADTTDDVTASSGDEDSTRRFGTATTGRESTVREELAIAREPVTRRMLIDAVWRNTWPHDRLVFGASRLIRVADATVLGKKLRVHSNRGLAGIDGTVSTGIGIALASQRENTAGITRVLLGDLALLHDAGGMLVSLGETRPRIQVVVGNDGAGTIFADLEVAATADPKALSRVLLTPQRVDLDALACAYGWKYRAAKNRNELESALTERTVGPTIIDVRLDGN